MSAPIRTAARRFGSRLGLALAGLVWAAGGVSAQVEADPGVRAAGEQRSERGEAREAGAGQPVREVIKPPEGEGDPPVRIEIREGRARLRIQPGDLPDELTDEQREALIRRMLEARQRENGVRISVEIEEAYQPPADISKAMGPLRRLEARLTEPGLSAQERAELVRDGRRVFERAPRAALGVQFRTAAAEGAVTIERALDGFPVSEYLSGGDEITHIDGRPLAGTEHLRAEILSRLPGETLPMRVRRSIPVMGDPAVGEAPPAEKILEIEVPLGGYEQLEQSGPDERLLHAAWRARVERLLASAGIGEGPEIGAGLSANDWLRNERLWRPGDGGETGIEGRAGDGQGIFGDVAPERIISIGGRPTDAAERTAFRRSNMRSLLRGAQARAARGRQPGTTEARTTHERLRDAMDTYRVVSLEIASYRTALEQVRSGRAGDDRLSERMGQLRTTIERLRSNLEALRGEIAELQREIDERESARSTDAAPRDEGRDTAPAGAGAIRR